VRLFRRLRWGPATTIRVRLGVALALALAPVLLLGAGQSILAYKNEQADRQRVLQAAAQRSAASARAQMESASILLETLGPGAVGVDCSQNLAKVKERLPGYSNLIRFDRLGRVACFAESVPPDPQRTEREWFRALDKDGKRFVTLDPGAKYSDQPSVFMAIRAPDPNYKFTILAAVIPLTSLQPKEADPTLRGEVEVAIVDQHGTLLDVTKKTGFPARMGPWVDEAARQGQYLVYADDSAGVRRAYSVARLYGNLFVVLSAPSRGLFQTAWLDPLSGIVFPLIAFFVALGAVFFAAERGVGRWIIYLQRVAAIYARGRFTVRPLQADRAPPEIRELAETLDHMAATIVARDAALNDNLAQKDALMREIHHRVTNNLQVISSLLSMQERALSDHAARQAMSDTRQRITALALIYRALYQGADIKHVDLKPFLEELTGQLLAGDMSAHGSVRTEVRADRLVIDPDKLAPLSLFAVEAITNAQKHALSEQGGTLTVLFSVNGPEAELVIADDGGGKNAPPDPEAIKGVGRTLMTAFARQLRGKASLERNELGGLTARLIFPTPEAAPAGT
jgi:two-component sensor histidine kinase